MELVKDKGIQIPEKDMNQTKIGDYLRSKREAMGAELIQISEKTKININVLRRLEDTDFDNLPNKAYIRGFVTNYVKYVKGDIQEALSVLDLSYKEYLGHDLEVHEDSLEDSQTTNIVEKLPDPELKKTFGKIPQSIEPSPIALVFEKISKIVTNKNFILPAIGVLFVSGLVMSIYNYIDQKIEENGAVAEQTQEADAPQMVEEGIKGKDASLFLLEKAKKLKKNVVKEEPKVEETAQATSTTEETPATTTSADVDNIDKLVEQMREAGLLVQRPVDLRDSKVIREKTEEDEGNYPYVKFTRIRNGNLFDIEENSPDLENFEIFPELARKAFNPAKQNVFINATDGDSWLTFKLENKEVKSLILRQGKMLFLQADQIQLFMGNANVTKIFYNNQKTKITTRSGVKSLIFPEENATNYELPLFAANKKGVLYTSTDYKVLMDDKPIEEDED
jgi:cytoskeleton protein RodZ